MLRDITIGQYYPEESFIHKLDPRVKLLGAFLFVVSVFIYDNLLGFAIMTFFLGLCIVTCKVPLKFMVKGLKAILFILILTGVINLFLTPGTSVFSWRFINITKQGIYNTVYMIIRLTYLVLGSSIMTLTTTPTRLTDGMETGLRFLKFFKFPVHEVAMMMSIALRFIPILIEEADKIMKAQMARGADFETGGLIKKAKNMVPLLVPLFVSAWRRAGDLAMAMEARCYNGGEGRTRMKPLKYQKCDYIAYLILLIYLGAMIATRIIFKADTLFGMYS